MTVPQVYVRTHSVSLPGEEANDGAALVWCACYDGGLAGTGTATVYYRLFQVDDFDANGVPQSAALVEDIDGGTISNAPKEKTGPWNRDEAGYGWPETTTVIPNEGESGEWPAGLYVVMVSDDGSWTDKDNHVSWAFFVVRRRTEYTKALVCYPFATLAAYWGGRAVPAQTPERGTSTSTARSTRSARAGARWTGPSRTFPMATRRMSAFASPHAGEVPPRPPN